METRETTDEYTSETPTSPSTSTSEEDTHNKIREMILLRINESTLMKVYLYHRPQDEVWMNENRKQQCLAALQSLIPIAIKKHSSAKEKEKSLGWIQRFPTFNLIYRTTEQSTAGVMSFTYSKTSPYQEETVTKCVMHVLMLPTQVALVCPEAMCFGFTFHPDAFKETKEKKQTMGTLDKYLQ
jgi:hypothetical protein